MFDFRRGQKYLSDGSRRIDTYSGEELSDIPYLHYTCKIYCIIRSMKLLKVNFVFLCSYKGPKRF
jgi:hypothetical protein